MARLTGLEPATPGVTGRYSNQLSYNRSLPAAPSVRWTVRRGVRGVLWIPPAPVKRVSNLPQRQFAVLPQTFDPKGKFALKKGVGAPGKPVRTAGATAGPPSAPLPAAPHHRVRPGRAQAPRRIASGCAVLPDARARPRARPVTASRLLERYGVLEDPPGNRARRGERGLSGRTGRIEVYAIRR